MNDVVKEKEWIGYWWLPGQEENKIHGTLHYKLPSELWLDLSNPFHKKSKYVLKGGYRSLDISEKAIQGTASGRKFTLFNCRLLSDFPFPHYFIDYAIEGDYFDNPMKASFKNWTIELSEYFNDWFGLSERKIKFNKKERVGEPLIDVKYIKKPTDEFSFILKDISPTKDFVLRINPYFNFEAKTTGSLTCIRNNTLIKLEDREHNGVNIEQFIKVINKLFPLFEFFANNLLVPKEIYASNGSFKETGKLPNSIYCAYSDIYSLEQVKKKYDLTKIVLSYPDLRESFQSILNAYFEKRDYLFPLLYAVSITNIIEEAKTNFLQHDLVFFRLITALENYCKVFESKNHSLTKRFGKEKFKAIREAIDEVLSKNDIPKEERQDIVEGFSNSMGLRNRLVRLWNSWKWNKFLSISKEEMGLFNKDVVDKRNQIAHGDNRETNLSGINLWWSINVLKILICITIMKELGIDMKTVETCLKNNTEFSMARQELVKYLKTRKDKGELL